MSSLYITPAGTCENLKHFIPELSSWVYKVSGEDLKNVVQSVLDTKPRLDTRCISYVNPYLYSFTEPEKLEDKIISLYEKKAGLTVEESANMLKEFKQNIRKISVVFSELYKDDDLKKLVSTNYIDVLHKFIGEIQINNDRNTIRGNEKDLKLGGQLLKEVQREIERIEKLQSEVRNMLDGGISL